MNVVYCFFFLFSIFLVTSIGLVYIGFTKWVGIELKKLWYDRKRFLGDIDWGIIGFLITFISLLAIVIVVSTVDLIPSRMATAQLSPIQYLLSLFFGFAIAFFQEETIFRGFLQSIFMEKKVAYVVL